MKSAEFKLQKDALDMIVTCIVPSECMLLQIMTTLEGELLKPEMLAAIPVNFLNLSSSLLEALRGFSTSLTQHEN